MTSRRPEAADAGAPGRIPDATAPSLVVGGVMMLLTVFLVANPWFGVVERLWPWEMSARGLHDPLIQTVLYIWIATALWILILGLTRAQRVRSVGAATLVAVLLVECTGRGGGFVIDLYNLNQVLPMAGLGAGFLIARRRNTRGLGRIVTGISSLVLIWVLASTFVEEGTVLQITSHWRDLQLVAADWNHEFARPNHVWWTLIPRSLVILAALAGLLVLLGVTQRHYLMGGFVLLLLGVIFPFGVGSVLLLEDGGGMDLVVQQLAQSLMSHGVALWYVSVFVIFDLARERMRAA